MSQSSLDTHSRDRTVPFQDELGMSHSLPVLPQLKGTVILTVASSKAVIAPVTCGCSLLWLTGV